DQLRALEPDLGLARLLWRSKELRARQPLHDLPPMVGWWLADHNQILPLITAVSWHAKPTYEKDSQRPLSPRAKHSPTAGVVAGPDSHQNGAPSRIPGGQGNVRRPEALSLWPSRSPGLGNREAYHATKAALAGLRPRGTRSARDRNGYD